jgi:predicted  nucleic acid-binding Zn-ribbon protein
MSKKFKYEILTPNEDPQLATIVKRKVDVEFTMQQLDDQEHALTKKITELKAQRDYEDAVCQNVEHFHEWVKDFDAEKISTLSIYTKARTNLDQINPVLAKYEEVLAEHLVEVAEIKHQIGYVETDTSTEQN